MPHAHDDLPLNDRACTGGIQLTAGSGQLPPTIVGATGVIQLTATISATGSIAAAGPVPLTAAKAAHALEAAHRERRILQWDRLTDSPETVWHASALNEAGEPLAPAVTGTDPENILLEIADHLLPPG